MWMLCRPTERQLVEYLLRAADEPLSGVANAVYSPILLQRRMHLGSGMDVLRRCGAAMQRWCMVPGAMVDLYWPQRPACAGTTLATGMRLAGTYWVNPWRITEWSHDAAPVDGIRSITVRWQTVRGHCLVGHESFRVCMDDRTGEVYYEISSATRPLPWVRPFSRRIDRMRREFQHRSCEELANVALWRGREPNQPPAASASIDLTAPSL